MNFDLIYNLFFVGVSIVTFGIGFSLGSYLSRSVRTSFHTPTLSDAHTFTENTYFVDPIDPQEAFKSSKNVQEFINKLQ